jgi:hypothetical protein
MDESKLVFFTGAPGSKWSAVAHTIAQSKKYLFDTGDYAPDRQYAHSVDKDIVAHNGAYFGPGFPFGDSFDKVAKLPKDEVYREIEDAWITQNGGLKIIKCHQFSIDLADIHREFPTSKIIICYRNNEACEEGWFGAGGFDIPYPQYKEAYTNRETMIKKIADENMHNLKFIRDEQLEMHVANQGHFKNYWGVDINDKLNAKFVKLIEGIPMHWHSKYSETVAMKAKNDVLISTLGFKEV